MTHPTSFRLPAPLLLLFLLSVLLLPSHSAAEPYVAGMVGYTAPNDLTNVQGTGGASGFSLSDLALKNSAAYGGKVGYFFPGINWLGVETELYNTTQPYVERSVIPKSTRAVFTEPALSKLARFSLRGWPI